MAVVSQLVGRRSRGIVWVCDIQSSSKYLNNDESAEALEKFLQRFLFLSIIFVEAAGGKFIKWTMEHDALVIDLSYSKNRSTDVLGRAVVLAFRLSSIKSGFPSIITQGELLKLTKGTGTIHFQRLKLSKADKVRYFKDEKWGTGDIFVSGDRVRTRLSLRTLLRRTKETIDGAEGRRGSPAKHTDFTAKLLAEMSTGPDWAQDVEKTVQKFVSEELLGSLKQLVPILEKQKEQGGAPSTGEYQRLGQFAKE